MVRRQAPKAQIYPDWTCMVPIRRSIVAFFVVLLAGGALHSRAQVVPSARRGQFSITAGALGSVFQPDYAGSFVPATSPNRLYGVGTYVDVKFTRWLQIEAEGRWLRYNTYLNIDEDNYLIGPRLPLHHFHFLRATPYVKALIGYGKMNFENNEATGSFTDIAYGGGVDLRLSRRISIRAFDIEYQQWPKWVDNQELSPYGASVGIGYKIF
jgi:hypothetical protein